MFASKSSAQESAKDREAEVEKLHAKIGQLLVERDFLAEALSMSLEWRHQIEPAHAQLSVLRQCQLVSISRSGVYRPPAAADQGASPGAPGASVSAAGAGY